MEIVLIARRNTTFLACLDIVICRKLLIMTKICERSINMERCPQFLI